MKIYVEQRRCFLWGPKWSSWKTNRSKSQMEEKVKAFFRGRLCQTGFLVQVPDTRKQWEARGSFHYW